MFRNEKAQSTLEYIIVFTFVVAAILFFANGVLKTKMKSMLEHSAGQADNAVSHINFGNSPNTGAENDGQDGGGAAEGNASAGVPAGGNDSS